MAKEKDVVEEQEVVVERQSKEELKTERIKSVHAEERKVFDVLRASVKTDYQELVSDCYTELDAVTDMLIRGIGYGAVVFGAGGTGKTWRVMTKCIQSNISFEYVDSFSTPANFYIWLFKNRDKQVLIVDDVAGIFQNNKILAFLKGALWHTVGKRRIISYLTTKPLQDEYGMPIPSTCEINARIIIITNQINKKSPHVQAVLSRIFNCEVEIPREELLRILRDICLQDYDGLSEDERLQCLSFLEQNTTDQTENLNIRTLLKIFDFRKYSKESKKPKIWETLSLKMLKKDDSLVVVKALMEDASLVSEEDRVQKFFELTGRSRPTYFRYRKVVERQMQAEKAMVG